MKTFHIRQLIEEVAYEIAMRERVYPGLVAKGKLRQGEADYHLDRMRAVKAKLEDLAARGEQRA